MHSTIRFLALTVLMISLSAGAWAGSGGPCGTGTVHTLPEPASIALLAAGVAGIFVVRKRSGRK